MIQARQARAADAPELVRLRGVMLASLHGAEPEPGPWQERAAQTIRDRFAAPEQTLIAFVVPAPDQSGRLCSCAVGTVEQRLSGPDNPTGNTGYVFNVTTDPGYRRRGYSRACMEGLLGWYRRRGITKIDLRASAEGLPLYLSLGFAISGEPAMRLRLSAGEPAVG